ncbi:23S rRNA (adenine(2503)-C(2))-methyltransferase RlmN [Desulfotomaculum copahuensis]|nr:23S rRNA (adenine(2503)-C(2))-methyltransferase RlmN [Desulfotomaculum copahuensis]
MKSLLMDMNLTLLTEFMAGLGEPPFRAGQLARWLFQRGAVSWAEMTDLPLALRERLQETAVIGGLSMVKKQVSRRKDTVKYLFGLSDGQAVESVLMRHSYGRSACVSTQVGCRMGCRFCASTLGGLVRPLSAGEIYGQVLAIGRDSGQRISHVVLMGSGEPLDNFDPVMRFLENITSSYGLNISYRHITLSTCGLVPRIRELARRRLAITLAVSLHAPADSLRDRLVPVNRRYPLGELLPACREYAALTGRRITFEYALLSGVNDAPGQACQLARLLRGLPCHVNLIPFNPVAGRGFKRSAPERVRQFLGILREQGVNATVRRELGADIDAACGQLRRRSAGMMKD